MESQPLFALLSGMEDIRARLETEAPLDGEQDVMFQAGAFRFRLPGFEEGQVPSLLLP